MGATKALRALLKPEWFDEPFVRRIIKTIDNVEVTSCWAMQHPVFGVVNASMLSCGCASLVLAYKLDYYLNGETLGDNCFPLLAEISANKDIHMRLAHLLKYPSDIEMVIENTGDRVQTYLELCRVVSRLPNFYE